MNKFQEEYINRLWETKYISEPDESWFITKVFKTRDLMLPMEEQKRLLELKKKYFGEYIPETELFEIQDWEYMIRQKFIKWKTIAHTDISDLSAETLEKFIDLIKKYLKYHEEQWGAMDITGFQYHEWNPNNLKRRIKNFLKIRQNFLTSTNIMIWDDWNVYMVDICDSAIIRLQSRIKNFCAKPFVKRTIKNLEKALQQKIEIQKEQTSKELLETLKW